MNSETRFTIYPDQQLGLRLAREHNSAIWKAYFGAEKVARNLSENTSLDTGPDQWSTQSYVGILSAPHGHAIVYNPSAMVWLFDHNNQSVQVPRQQDIEAVELGRFEPDDKLNAERRAKLILGLEVRGDTVDAERVRVVLDATAPFKYEFLPDLWKAHLASLEAD